MLEQRCLGGNRRSSGYADRVYARFGALCLADLMRNLAELDWRMGRTGESGLHLLDGIWADIHRRFAAGDEYQRHQILADLTSAAIYQPSHVLRLVRAAIDEPIVTEASAEEMSYRAGQEHVVSTLPGLLEATAHHPDWLQDSIAILWDVYQSGEAHSQGAIAAKEVLKRLSAWQRFKSPVFNFAVLLQAIRLTRRRDALAFEFTPFSMISEILEREGEFNEWAEENTISFGGFGLNYQAVGPVRENAIDFLEYVLETDGPSTYIAIGMLKKQLHNFLNRVSRISTEEELDWQNRERERCLGILLNRFELSTASFLKARIFDAVRSGTAINCPARIRQLASGAITHMQVDDTVTVIDAICTADHDLPLLSATFDSITWYEQIESLMRAARLALERVKDSPTSRADLVIEQVRACRLLGVKPNGFSHFVHTFHDNRDFLLELLDRFISEDRLVNELSAILRTLHSSYPRDYCERARAILASGSIMQVRAAAHSLRALENAFEDDVALIKAYGAVDDRIVKEGALNAIAYMGKFVEVRELLLNAALSIETGEDAAIASELADAFGPYGVPLTLLNRSQASLLTSRFLRVRDWDSQQGAIPRFLCRMTDLFPEEVFDLLVQRISLSYENGRRDYSYRTFGLVHQTVSLAVLPLRSGSSLPDGASAYSSKLNIRSMNLSSCSGISAVMRNLTFQLALAAASSAGVDQLEKIAALIEGATPRLAFSYPQFARDLICSIRAPLRERIIEALASQARQSLGGVFAGDTGTFMANESARFEQQLAALPPDAELEELANALRRLR